MRSRITLSSATFFLMELVFLLGIVPVLVMQVQDVYRFRHAVLLIGCVYIVWRLRVCVHWRFLFQHPPARWWVWPCLRGGFVFAAALLYVKGCEPELLFSFPLQRPWLWAAVVVLYPLLSVLPQELIYRVYVFEAHAALWKQAWQPVVASALFFGWVHIIYAGWFAVASTFIGGIALALVYRSRRHMPGVLWVLLLEHALYGLTMFTVGLGRYFFLAR